MSQELNNKKIAILVADGFEQVELTKPKEAFEEAGAQTQIISLNSDRVQEWNQGDRGLYYSSSQIGRHLPTLQLLKLSIFCQLINDG